MSRFTKKITTSLFTSLLAVTAWSAPITHAQTEFPDVNENVTGNEEIQYLEDKGIIQGYLDGTFRPGNNVSRMEAAIMLTRELGLSTEDRPNPNFDDISTEHPHYKYVAALVDEGIIKGTDSNEFQPDRNIKRIEMAAVLTRAYNLENEPISKEFDDVSGNRKYVSEVVSNRISVGFPDNTFRPSAPTTRAQFSIFLARTMDNQFKKYLSNAKEDPNFESIDNEDIRGTYIWHAENVIEEPNEILEFAKENDINLLYTRLDRTQDYTVYNEFLEKAHEAGIEVHAMGGHPNWALKEGEERLNMFIDYVTSYQKVVPPRQQFDGIHLDIEPYVLQNWDGNPEDILKTWKTNIQVFVDEVKKDSDLETSADLAIWLDDHKTPGQEDISFSKWFISKLDHTTLMAFRDSAEGSNGIIDVSKKEMEFAKELGKELLVSVEMKQIKENKHISFYEEGKQFMEEQLDETKSYFNDNPSYHGNAVHAYEYWKVANE
ncbi:S-layer homology domain-containing protein [Pontibacillus sp. ALD_SL1]|uniref:S-layer homology domain-containing protein n=1 Tax=Pontibacillus sp. ALD_SL1 TaxID=2777185 RepID=UPI001A9655E4|nr:S-layer homology domain-containing protein [Pontibacillus sp. ALD_SL1]QSS98860.1 S-layer homology domain-containing protein [Pontibacillus sp. ALD_SL1]